MTSSRWTLVIGPCLAAWLLVPRIATADTYRLLLVGDSITEGQGATPGFRDDLHARLNADPNRSFVFVGSTGQPPLRGHFLGGREIEDFYPPSFGNGWGNGTFDTTPDMGPPGTPHVVAIHLGTNDLNSQLPPFVPYSFDHGQTLTHTHLGEMAEYLLFLLQWQDGTRGSDLSHLVLSLNIPMQGRSQDVRDWANGIIAMSEDFGEGVVTGSPLRITLADHYHRFLTNPDLFTFGPGDWMTDALHPNDAGYTQMADVYDQAIVAAVADSTAPQPIADLAVIAVDSSRVDLAFTAVGDDSLAGGAFRYDLRVATSLIDAQSFALAPQAIGEADPNPAGERDTLIAAGLLPGTTYYFAVKVVDDAGNRSAISNVRSATTIGSPTVVLTLRDGLNGYSGAEDNQLIDRRPVENAGASTSFAVGKHGSEPFADPELPAVAALAPAYGSADPEADPGFLVTDTSRSLLRFNLAAIPAGAEILSARLRCFSYERDSSTPAVIGAYRVTKHWVEGTRQTPGQQSGASCWNAAQLSVLAWSAPGLGAASDGAVNDDPSFDRFATPEDTTLVTGNNAWYEWDLTRAVGKWVDGTWNNDGVLLMAVDEFANSRRAFHSAESVVNQALRPTLVVTFAMEPVNAPPIAQAGGPYSGEEDQPIQFDGSGSFDPDGQPITYQWDFGDGATAGGATPQHVYTDAGLYTVTLVVSDGQASSDPDRTTATVAQTTGIAGPAAPLVTRLVGAAPNPIARSAAVRYDLAAEGRVVLRLVDVEGRVALVLVDEVEETGQYRLLWNGADAEGRRLPAGIYFLHLDAAGVSEARKLVLLP